jgi:antirestriction protein ArdC
MGFDTYQAVTDEITAALERGVVPWHKPWQGGTAPENLISHKAYRGINNLLLSLAESAETPYWLTFKQAQGLGGRVRKGEHGRMVVFFKQLKVTDKKDPTKMASIPMLRYYKVFNAAQCDGIDLPAPAEPWLSEGDAMPIESAQCLIDGMPDAPTIQHGGNRAFYRPSLDTITLPERQSFESMPAYYGTAFHELGHATGHASRLNRFDNDTEWSQFGSQPYGKEELVAELTSAYLCNVAGMDHVDPSASYIDNWLRAIKSDKRLIVGAAGKAARAADCVRGIAAPVYTP